MESGMIVDLKRRFFNHIIELDYSFHTTHKTGSLISRLTRGGGAMERMTDVIIFNIAPMIFSLAVVTASLIYFDLGPIIDNTNFMMYNFLKSNNYQGIILYNDIKHQYNYDYFWKKIPDTEKVDLTDIGNFMGIGMITFNDDYRRSFF